MHLQIYFHCTSSVMFVIKLSNLSEAILPPKSFWIVASASCWKFTISVDIKFQQGSVYRCSVQGVNKLRKLSKKRGQRHIQDPVKRLGWIIFIKKTKKLEISFVKRSRSDVWEGQRCLSVPTSTFKAVVAAGQVHIQH